MRLTQRKTAQFGHANMKCCHRCQTSNQCVQIIAGLPDLCLILLVDRTQKLIPIVMFRSRACLRLTIKLCDHSETIELDTIY